MIIESFTFLMRTDASGMKLIARGLEGNKTIKVLDLSSNLIMDDGAGVLAQVYTLLQLLAYRLFLSAAALSVYIASPFCTLHAVSLACNTIGNKGFSALLSSVSQNNTLKTLDLRANYINDEGRSRILQYAL
jgi:Ran GTPase-activating protein (RanGAP) involved in mRNA processing and transport